MALEVCCPSCEGRFRVPETAAGKKIRCPKCKGAMEVPIAVPPEEEPAAPPPPPPPPVPASPPAAGPPAVSAPPAVPAPPPASNEKIKFPARWAVGDDFPVTDEDAPPAAPGPSAKSGKPASPKVGKSAPPPPAMWLLKGEDGEEYGPVPREELDAWKEEGRITGDCQLLLEGTGNWQWAAEVYPDLEEALEQPIDIEEPPPVPSLKAPKAKGNSAARKAARAEPRRDMPAESRSSRSKAIAGLLGIFLGPLGTHRFYLGYWGIGLAMLFTGGGCGIWSLIDAVLVLLGRVTDADGRPLSD